MNNNAKKKKEQRQNLYVTIIVLLMMVAVIAAIATSLAKNPAVVEDPKETDPVKDALTPEDTDKKNENADTQDVFFNNDDEKETQDGKEDTDKADTETEKTEAEPSAPAKEPLPVFIAPVRGELLKGVSLETPVFSNTMEDYRTHTGVDLYCSAGGDVAAAAAGTITEISNDPMMGTSIYIQHSGGAVSVYKNLSEELPEGIAEGKTVSAGQIIATAGDTALLELAEESHIHFELKIDGNLVDPCDYIEFASPDAVEE